MDDDLYRYSGRNCIIYLIDAHPNMFVVEDEHLFTKFQISFDCVEKSMMNMIINSEKDLNGIVFFNTRDSVKPDHNFKIELPQHTSVFMPMEKPSKEMIQKVKSYREYCDFSDFDEEYGSSDEPAQFDNVLWLCSKLFASSAVNLQTKTIVLFTCNDQPHPKYSDEFRKSFVRANDLRDQQIDMTVVPMKECFDGNLFYHELICTVTNQDPDTFSFPESKQSIESYMTRIYRKDYRKKCIRHLKMSLGDNATLGVMLYSMFRESKNPQRVTIIRQNNEPITSRREYAQEADNENKEGIVQFPVLLENTVSNTIKTENATCFENSETTNSISLPVLPENAVLSTIKTENENALTTENSETINNIISTENTALIKNDENTIPTEIPTGVPFVLKKCIEFGGEKIVFTEKEINGMKITMEPGIRLLGFKPLTSVQIHCYLDPIAFMFYDDEQVTGSSKLYRALWEKCIEKEKLAICILTLRSNTYPKYVALIPQRERKSPNGTTFRHAGFRVFRIPYQEHIRDINNFQSKELWTPETEQIDVFEKIIKKLRFKYLPENFENPKLRHLYSVIEAAAFITELEDGIIDSTLPPVEQQDIMIEPFMETITTLFGEISVALKKGTKRNSKGEASDRKLRKISNELNQMDADAILEAISNGNIKNFTVPQLKAFLQAKGLSGYSKLTKSVLIQKIKEYLEVDTE